MCMAIGNVLRVVYGTVTTVHSTVVCVYLVIINVACHCPYHSQIKIVIQLPAPTIQTHSFYKNQFYI